MEKKVSKTERGRRPVSETRRAERRTPTWRKVYEDLRNEIVDLKRQPSEPLNEKEIAQSYGISRTPVREATLRLADEGLIEVFPQSGTFVARIPFEDLPEAMAIRKALEQLSVSRAAQRATRSDVVSLAAIVERQRESRDARDETAFHAADEQFHAEIVRISGYPGIWRLVMQVKTQVDRYRRTTLASLDRMDQVISDHEAILAAIASADPERAVTALNAHLDAVLPQDETHR